MLQIYRHCEVFSVPCDSINLQTLRDNEFAYKICNKVFIFNIFSCFYFREKKPSSYSRLY